MSALALLSGSVGLAGAAGQAPPMPPVVEHSVFFAPDTAEQGALVTGWLRLIGSTATLTLDGSPVPVAADGRFVIGFDRDAAPGPHLLVAAAPGALARITHVVTVTPRAWSISRLSTLPKYPVPAPEFAAVRPAELARIVAARATVTDADGWRQHFRWPASGRLSTAFGSQRVYANGEGGEPHSGADVAVPEGTPVVAPADSVVVLAAETPFTLEGNLLMLDHGMGVNSALLHLSRIVVREGEHVRQGQLVAYSGRTGRATGPHLHWSLRWRAARGAPLRVVGAGPTAGL